MRIIARGSVVILMVLPLLGCEFKKNISRDEIPIIKQSIAALETAIRAKSTVYLDSLLAGESEQTSLEIVDFVYTDGQYPPLDEFVGFTDKQIFFRGDAARVDCSVAGPGGPVKDVTITLKKEDEVWLIKRIESRYDEPLREEGPGQQ